MPFLDRHPTLEEAKAAIRQEVLPGLIDKQKTLERHLLARSSELGLLFTSGSKGTLTEDTLINDLYQQLAQVSALIEKLEASDGA